MAGQIYLRILHTSLIWITMTQRAHGSAINKHEWYGMLETKLFLLLRIVSNSGHVLFLDFRRFRLLRSGRQDGLVVDPEMMETLLNFSQSN